MVSMMPPRSLDFYMSTTKHIRAHVIADTISATISICGCDYCLETGLITYSLRLAGPNGKEYASAGQMPVAIIQELLRILSNITGGNLISWVSSDSGSDPNFATANSQHAIAKTKPDGCI
jgi:hypothetical protein